MTVRPRSRLWFCSFFLDLFEVAVLIGACFIVNYVTADAKTNYAEGFAMVAFYVMIVSCMFFFALSEADDAEIRRL